jgi:hypothetical protein
MKDPVLSIVEGGQDDGRLSRNMGFSIWTCNYQSRFEGESGVVVGRNGVCSEVDKTAQDPQSHNPRFSGEGECVRVAVKDPYTRWMFVSMFNLSLLGSQELCREGSAESIPSLKPLDTCQMLYGQGSGI